MVYRIIVTEVATEFVIIYLGLPKTEQAHPRVQLQVWLRTAHAQRSHHIRRIIFVKSAPDTMNCQHNH